MEPHGANPMVMCQAEAEEDRRNPEVDNDKTIMSALDAEIAVGPVGSGEALRGPVPAPSMLVVGATEGIPRHADKATVEGTWDASAPPLTLHEGLDSGAFDGNHGHACTETLVRPGIEISAVVPGFLDTNLSNLAALEDLETHPHASCEEQRALATLTEGMTTQEDLAFTRLKSFCSNIVKKLAPPLLKEVQAATLRPQTEPFTPRCTTRTMKRLAPACTTKAIPVENMLLRALGLVSEDLTVDDEAVQELKDLFDSPLREQHVRVIAALFGKTVPLHDREASAARSVEDI
ncbi:hypothetical protein VPH35_045865 [Triticum aestivum]